ncbi:unnamed protein product [Parajaminaea phylloscopi]
MLHGVEWLGRQYSALSKGAAANQTLVQTITTLATRLTEAAKTENPVQERRAAILSLKGLAKDHAKEVGQYAGKELLDCLVGFVAVAPPDSANDDVARSLLESLLAVCTPPEPAPATQGRFVGLKRPVPVPESPALDLFLEDSKPMHALLPLLAPQRTFYLRFAALQLLALLLRHRKVKVQSHVLTSPGGCGAILECLATTSPTGQSLGSSAEIIRNEALLLLPHLVDANTDIQKLIAFEGAFEKLLDVVAQEGRIEGGVVVQDALEALEALLRYNVSNQNYFRETLSIPLLAPLLFYPPPLPANAPAHLAAQRGEELERFSMQPWEYDASEDFGGNNDQGPGSNIVGDSQKLINAQLVIGVAGLLVHGSGEGRRANQNALLSTGFLHALLDLAVGSSAPLPLKTQALQVLSSLARNSRNVQDALGEAGVSPVEPIKTQLAADLAQPETDVKGPPSEPSGSQEQASVPPSASPPYQMIEYARLPPQSALISLISAALDGVPAPLRPIDGGARSLLGFRAAAVKALQSIFGDNIDARLYVVASMASSEQTRPEEQPGAVLLEALTKLPANGQEEGFNEYRALFAGMILSSVVKGAETVKELACRIRYDPSGQIVIAPERSAEGGEQKSGGRDDDDDDDDAVSLLSVLIGNITVALRSQSDALRAERSHSVGSPAPKGPTSTSWTRILLGHLTLLALWLHSSPASVRDLVQDSSNLQTIVQLVAEGANGEHLLVGMGSWVLGTIYEWGPAPAEGTQNGSVLTRQDIYDLVTSRIGVDQFQAKLERLRDDPRLKLVGPDVLDRVSHRADPIQVALAAGKASPDSVLAHLPLHREGTDGKAPASGAGADTAEEAVPEMWFDWTFSEFWRHESATVTNSILVAPTTTSAAASSAPAELLDAQQQIEQLRDQVRHLQQEVETRERLLSEKNAQEGASHEERSSLRQQLEQLTTAKGGHDEELNALRTSHETSLASLKSSHQSDLEKLQRSLDDSKMEVSRAADSSSSALAASQERVAAVEKLLAEERERREAAEESSKAMKEQVDSLSREQSQLGEKHAATEQARIVEAEEAASTAREELQRAQAELEEIRTAHTKAQAELRAKLEAAESEVQKLSASAASTGAEKSASENKTESGAGGSSGKSVAELEQEVEDLLICLDELSTKRKAEKAKLREKGVEVSDDEEEDEGDGDDDEDDDAAKDE